MKFYKLKANEDIFKFDTLEFTDDLKLTEESKNRLEEFLKDYVEVIEYKTQKEFISIITEQLNLDQSNIGNTIDVHTTDKRIYQLCYLERSSQPLNFLGTIINTKRTNINGDVFIFANKLITTKIPLDSKTAMNDYIQQDDMSFDELIDIIIVNYFNNGLCFDLNKYYKYVFDNNMDIVAPSNLKGIKLSELSFKRSDLLNKTIDIFYEAEGKSIKEKYNTLLSNFYLETFNNRIFIALQSNSEKKYESIIDEYIVKYINIYNKYCFDDDEIRVPKELKFYDYQSNDKYTNKYIVFDNLYDKIVLK